jgi:hypothetical protein
MNLSPRALFKGIIAIFLGLPTTVLLMPAVVFCLLTGGILVVVGFRDGSFGPAAKLFLWGLAGLVGLIGFWLWVFTKPGASRTRRFITAAFVLAGVCAVVPLVVATSVPYSALYSLPCAAGLLICLWVAIPAFPLNPDSPQRWQRGD